jgi:hypothetical protein
MIRIRPARPPAPWPTYGLILLGAAAIASFSQLESRYQLWLLRQEALNLPVPAIAQSQTTSCGEAAITMAYNFAHPENVLTEAEVIAFAEAQGYFTEDLPPYTSPANMVNIARHYADRVETGRVVDARQGISLLLQQLQRGRPVIIDVLTRLDDPDSEAHFVVVTGISVDPERADTIVIHYNNPLTGRNESADWAGAEGIWNAWQNNGDPGGAGWWLLFPSPR